MNFLQTLQKRADFKENRMFKATKKSLLKNNFCCIVQIPKQKHKSLTEYYNFLKNNNEQIKILVFLILKYEPRLKYSVNICRNIAYNKAKESKKGNFKELLIFELKKLLLDFKEKKKCTVLEKYSLKGYSNLTLIEKTKISIILKKM